MIVDDILVLSCLSLRGDEWLSGHALVWQIQEDVMEGELPAHVESAIASLVEKGYAEIRPTQRVIAGDPDQDDWRCLVYRITREGRVALSEALH